MSNWLSFPIKCYFDSQLFAFPPDEQPWTVVPAMPTAKTWMRPFSIPEGVYLAALHPRVPLTCAIVYLAATYSLNKANDRRRKPWPFAEKRSFKVAVILHNVFLAVYSAWTFWGLFTTMRGSIVSPIESTGLAGTVDSLCRMHGTPGLDNSQFFNSSSNVWQSLQSSSATTYPDIRAGGRIWNEGLGYYGWLFYLSKLYEVVDSFIILAKGRRTSTLQTYHHAGAMLCVWAGIRYMSPPIWLFVFINSFIHAIMYSYYALVAVRLPVPRAIKRALTTVQILQLITGTVYSSLHPFIRYKSRSRFAVEGGVSADGHSPMWQACLTTPGETFAIVVNVAYLLPLLYLFVQFFVTSYVRKN